MPPVLNTYGTRKKKRRGIPKYVFQEGTDDVFEALKIDNLKETKAHHDAKRKARGKKKASVPQQSEPVCLSFYAGDTTFDRLLKDGPTNSCGAPVASSDSSCSSSFDVSGKVFSGKLVTEHSKKLKRVFKKSVKGNGLKSGLMKQENAKKSKLDQSSFFGAQSEGSVYLLDGSQLKENSLLGNAIAVGSKAYEPPTKNLCSASVLIERNENKLMPLSPILPLSPKFGSTSTPCGKVTVKSFILSPEAKCDDASNLCEVEDEVFQDTAYRGSIDLFASLDQKEQSDTKLNEGAHSVDMFSSYENCGLNLNASSDALSCKPVDHGTNSPSTDDKCISNEGHGASHSIYVCDSSNGTIPPVESAHVFESSSEVSDLTSCLGDVKLSSPHEDSHCDFLSSCRSEAQLSSTSVHFEDHYVPVRDCQVVLQKCDSASTQFNHVCSVQIKKSFEESVMCLSNIECGETVTSFTCQESGVVVENQKAKVDDCFVVLTRCDLISHVSEDLSSCQVPTFPLDREEGVCAVRLTQEMIELQRSNSIDALSVCDGTNVSAAVQDPELSSLSRDALELVRVDSDDEKITSKARDCKVVMSRCDDISSRKSASDTELTMPCDSTLSCEIVTRNLLERNSIGSSVSSQRSSINMESVVLKPGKQWRRSLSIMSKVRTSCGESTTTDVRKSLSVSNKLKGKRWGSTVSSLIQLQPASESIAEDLEASLGSLCMQESLSRLSIGQQSHDESVICEVPERVSLESAASLVYRRCCQNGPVPFSKFFPANMKKNCKKIGEGVYGEVFFFSGSANRPPSVIKIIPIEGEMEVNGEPQKTFGEIISEVVVAQELSNLRRGVVNVTRTFNEVQAIRCVQGCYPDWLQELWHDFDDSKGSENDSPEMFQEKQLYIVLELSNGGKDLESFVFSSADQGLAAFRQVTLALAVAEEALDFEHRDLHWGNVLISNTKEKEISFTLNGKACTTATRGVEVSIIDFTLSRIGDPTSGKPIFYDLSKDETLFTAQGDYQFDIYRMMKEFNGNNWDTFVPKSNIAWLHYLLDKLCTMARYKNRSSKVHNRAIDLLSELRDTVLMFNNVSTFVKCDLFLK